MAEETTQKMENIILELNKTGLSYLVASNPSLKQISSQKQSIISKKQKDRSPKN